MKSYIPTKLKPFFWDTDARNLDLEKHRRYIIQRILEKGDIQSLKWLFKTYSPIEIQFEIENPAVLSEKTINFWKGYFRQYPPQIFNS